jgi:L-gulonolactone oxidase
MAVCLLCTLAAGGGLSWSDWDGLQTCTPADYYLPQTEEEIVTLVKSAGASKASIKVVGGGHSFSGIALTDGHMISLDKYRSLVSVNGTSVTVQAGIRLHDLNTLLEGLGLGLENIGACAQQSLAGAVATGTHGTGNTGSMSAQIIGMRIVTGTGEIMTATADQHADVFAAARVGLGALGVVSTITLRTMPLYHLEHTQTSWDLDGPHGLLEQLPALLKQYERLQWFWSVK